MSALQARPYQDRMITDIRRAVQQGHRRILVVLPTGGGKSVVAASLMQLTAAKGNESIFFASQRELITQIGNQLGRINVPSRTIMAGVDEHDGFEDRVDVLCSLVARDTLWQRAFKRSKMELPTADVMQIDECVTGDAIVQTRDRGPQQLKDIVVGDYVLSMFKFSDGWSDCWRLVTATYDKGYRDTVTVTVGDTHVRCTPEHEIKITRDGRTHVWAMASSLVPGDRVFMDSEGYWPGMATVTGVEKSVPERVYDITVEESHCFYANGILVHNCHQVGCPTYVSIMEAYEKSIIIGWTATPCRSDNRPLGLWFDTMVQGATYKELQDGGYLVPVKVIAPDRPDLQGCKVSRGDYAKGDLQKRMNRDEMVGNIVKEWLKHGQGRSTVLFAAGVDHSIHCRDVFRKEGITAEHIDGKMSTDERDDIMLRARNGQVRVLCNYGVCLDSDTEVLTSEGWVGKDQIGEDHLVANWHRDGTIDFRNPQRIVKKRFTGKMIAYKTLRRSIRVTPDHTIVHRRSSRHQWQTCDAIKMVGRRGLSIPISGIAEPFQNMLDQFQAEPVTGKRIASAAFGIRSRGLSSCTKESRDMAVATLSDRDSRMEYTMPSDLTIDDCMFIGFWIGDGTRSKDGRVAVFQSGAYPGIQNWITEVIGRCGFHYTTADYETKSGKETEHKCRRWNLSKGTGYGSQGLPGVFRLGPYMDKDGSDLLWCLTREQLIALLRGFWLADGNHGKWAGPDFPSSLRIDNTNKNLMDRLQAVCHCRGLSMSIQGSVNGSQDMKILYRCTVSDRSVHDIGEIRFHEETSETSEDVWCVQSDSGFIVTRRDGRVSVVGNCHTGVDVPNWKVMICARPTKSFGLFRQMAGRIQRPYQGHDHCLILDHSDNTLHFGFPDEDVEWEIDGEGDQGKKHMEAKKKEPGEKGSEPYACEKCHALYRGYACPVCGHKPEKKGNEIKMSSGELKELERAKANRKATPMDKQKHWDKCMGIAIQKNMKIGAAAHMYKEHFGCFPANSVQNVPRSSQWKMTAKDFYMQVVKPEKRAAEREIQTSLLW